jgi:hypothetical protein
MIRSRRAEPSRDRPLYARMLRLRHLSPSGFLCFVYLEGAVALGILLALAELVSWWGVLVLPLTVAAMVKLNDVVAGAFARPVAAAASAQVVAPPGSSVLRPATIRHVAGQETVRLSASGRPLAEDVSLRSRTVDLRAAGLVPDLREAGPGPEWRGAGPGSGLRAAGQVPDLREAGQLSADASALNGPPSPRQWAEELDMREQRARQSAARRYE